MTFDREGRLHFYFRRGSTYKRSLGSDMHLRFQEEGRQRRELTSAEAASIFAETYRKAWEVAKIAEGGLKSRLDGEILRWSPENLAEERERFLAIYRPVSILPPDQYLSIVVQATEGCSWNRCTFCSFYMDRPFRTKSTVEFRRHVEGVKDLLGEGIKLRRGVFLADGNALALSLKRLEPLVGIAREVFPDRPLFGFVDLFSGERRPADHWQRLAEMGLERVYVGMETGLDELLHLVNKPGSGAELVDFVSELKRASLSVCLILMMGLGGREYRTEHARASLDILERLPLDKADLVYLSPFVEGPKSVDLGTDSASSSLTPMSEAEVEVELQRFAVRVRMLGIKASRYDIREFIY
jgi:radical SAM superfamily enzyme YgiQ (UPF0313 family)